MARTRVCSDPELFRPTEGMTGEQKVVLGLDLGTNCGYTIAYYVPGHPVDVTKIPFIMGQWDLSAGPYDSGALRFVRLRQFLEATRPHLVAFEDVRYTPAEKPNVVTVNAIISRAATACELFGAWKATVSTWCEEAAVPCGSFPIGTIKKRATGKGNAGKKDMILACNELFGSDLDPETYESTGADNVADSAFVCLLALENYGTGLTKEEL